MPWQRWMLAAALLILGACGSEDAGAEPTPYEQYLANPPTMELPGINLDDWIGMSERDFMLRYYLFCDPELGYEADAPDGSAPRVIIDAFGGCNSREEVFERWVAEGLGG